MGPEGPRGPTNKKGLIGYLILAAGVLLALGLQQCQNDDSARQAAAIEDANERLAVQQKALEKAVEENSKANDALCASLRAKRQQSVQTREFLADHPNGLPALGLTREVIERGESIRQEEIRVLDRNLDCWRRPTAAVP
jgi:hypothetical protein